MMRALNAGSLGRGEVEAVQHRSPDQPPIIETKDKNKLRSSYIHTLLAQQKLP
jgi:hypothetical protein